MGSETGNIRRKHKGRGATTNRSGRFEKYSIEDFDDGWGTLDALIADEKRPPTEVIAERTKKILTTNDSPDVPFEQSINPYKGCEHGCIYCFARPTHAFLGLSPGLDFETKIFSKPRAVEALRDELAHPSYRCQPIALGANTDPYQPVEKRLRITRGLLELARDCHQPIGIVTKSQLVLRDLDILSVMAEKNLAHVFVSVTTLDPTLARIMEPRASTPDNRLETLRELTRAGIPAGVLSSPIIPHLNDSELEAILERAAEAGASSAGMVLLRLPLEIKDLFAEWLETHFPDKAKHVLGLVRDTRGGALYQSEFGKRMRGTGAYAALLQKRFEVATRRLALGGRLVPLDCTRFEAPVLAGAQMRLFD